MFDSNQSKTSILSRTALNLAFYLYKNFTRIYHFTNFVAFSFSSLLSHGFILVHVKFLSSEGYLVHVKLLSSEGYHQLINYR